MNCYCCNAKLIWGGDHDYEDYSIEGNGIVSNLSCPKCDSYVEVYCPIKKGKGENDGKKKND